MKKTLAFLLIAYLSHSFLIAQTPDDFSFKQSFKVSTPADMNISTNDGFIKVFASSSKVIEVYFIVKKNDRVVDIDMEELEKYVTLDIDSRSDALEISIKQKESNWIKNWKDRHNVSLQILAPVKTTCNLKTSDGDIEMIGLQGKQNCKTSDGDILIEDIQGNLQAKTSDGDIEISGIDGTLDASTSDGDINIKNIRGETSLKTSDGKISAEDINGDVVAITSDGNIIFENVIGIHSARTSDGNITFKDMKGSFSAQTSDGDIRGDFQTLSGRLDLKTSDGDISVVVPDGMGMDIRLKGEDIHTLLDDFSGNTTDHLIEGTIRGGGIEVELATSDGDIDLRYQ